MENAINALEEKQEEPEPDKADKTALEQAVAKAEELDANLYTEVSYQAVADALKAAKNVLADENADQAAVNQAKENLENAINALEEKQEEPKPDKADKTVLEEVMKQAEALDRTFYTEISYQAVVDALEAAKAILADEKAEQAAVDQAKENLTKAIEALEKKPVQPDIDTDDDDSDDDIQQNPFLTNREENLAVDALGTSSIKEVTENGSGKLVISKSNEVVFIEKNGTLSKNKWQQVDGSWYFFDKDSKAADGWLEQNGKWYYLNESDKKMETGWLKTKDGNWYLLDNINGDMKTGWQQTKDGKWYLLDYVNGDMKTDWQQTKDGK